MQAKSLSCKIAFVNKEEIVEDFFRGLKVVLTNAFSYSKEHPYFIKSVENFKAKLEAALLVLNPLKIGVTNLGLVVDGKNLTRSGFYDELARLLHQRKIKSVEIKNGVNLEELIQFLSVISLSQKEIFKAGGINTLLNRFPLTHFTIEELDYSAFLQGEGKECVDFWGYLLKEAVCSNDTAKLDKLSDDFGPLIRKFNEKDVFDTLEVFPDIGEFLACLKSRNKEKFDQCTKDIFLWLLRNKKLLSTEKLAKLGPVFEALSQEDFSTLLWEGLQGEDSFDALSLQLFSKISEQKDALKIAEGFANKAGAAQTLSTNPRIVKRIQDLLTGIGDDHLSAVYRNTLEFLIKGISSTGELTFDQKALKENYLYIVLSILATGQDKDSLKTAAVVLEKELNGVFEEGNFVFLKSLWGVLEKRRKENTEACAGLEKFFSAFIEDIVLSGNLPIGQDFLLGAVLSPSQKPDLYLDKIFNAEKVDRRILILFLKLFGANLGVFYAKVAQRHQDLEFLVSLIGALGELGETEVSGILKYLYTHANELIKFEVLKAMSKLNKVDAEFLLRQLNTDSLVLRRSLVSLLMPDERLKKSTLVSCFKIFSPWGIKNDFLMENMQIVFDLKFSEAVSYIQELSFRKFFWNKKLRNKAKKILKEWNAD